MRQLACLLALILTMGGLAVFAGPYFVIEQNPLLPAAELTVGWDFDAPYVDMTEMSVAGDFYFTNDNLWLYPTPWIAGFALDLDWIDVFGVGFGMDVRLLPVPFPDYVELEEWTTVLSVFGQPSDIVRIYGKVDLVFAVVNPPGPPGWVGIWTFVPVIGLECHWQ